MNTSSQNIIKLAFATFVFAIALSYALSSILETQKEFEYSPGTEDTVYSKQTKIPEEVRFSGAEVIGSIYKLSLDGIAVTVDGIAFNTPKDLKDKQITILKNATYSQIVNFKPDGSIADITYLSY